MYSQPGAAQPGATVIPTYKAAPKRILSLVNPDTQTNVDLNETKVQAEKIAAAALAAGKKGAAASADGPPAAPPSSASAPASAPATPAAPATSSGSAPGGTPERKPLLKIERRPIAIVAPPSEPAAKPAATPTGACCPLRGHTAVQVLPSATFVASY